MPEIPRETVLSELEADPKRLAEAAESSDPKTRARAARNPNTPENMLRALSNDPEEGVRAAVAERGRISEEILRRLATQDPSELVRVRAGANPNLPRDILEQRTRFGSPLERQIIAENSNLPTELAMQLLTSGDRVTVYRLAAHTQDRAVAEALLRDTNHLEALIIEQSVERSITDRVRREHIARPIVHNMIERLRKLSAQS
jgi:hypothetical protein